MLKGIHPLLSASLLAVLVEMGHGDEIAILGREGAFRP
jgi:L-fucose mutarotase/ribose pyranase (RbsD/FucU family)